MFLLKLKSALNLLSFAGIRVLVVSSAMLGSLMVVYSGYSIYEQVYTQNRAFDSGVRAFEDTAEIQDAQQSLKDARTDYRAWLRVDDTHIDYPVMQGTDDYFYARHDLDGNASLTGAIYMSSGNASDLSDNYIIIFGHHMANGAMFGDLSHFEEEAFFETHRDAVLISPDNTYAVKLFAAVSTDAYDEMIYKAGNRDLEELLAYISAHAIVGWPEDAKGAKKIVALSTCYDAATLGRMVVFGVLTDYTEPTPSISPEISVSPDEPQPSVSPAPSGRDGVGPDAPQTGQRSTWLGRFFDRFLPGGSSYGTRAWAFINLICVYLTLYILFPFGRLRGKYARIDKMRKLNDAKKALWDAADLSPAQLSERAELIALARTMSGKKEGQEVTKREFAAAVERKYYHVDRFARKFRLGVALQAALAAISMIVFFKTENMRLPMILIDKWTPLMLLLMVSAVVADAALTRYRENGAQRSEEA